MTSVCRWTSDRFHYRVNYAETYEQIEELAKELKSELDTNKETVLGFDTEMIDSRLSAFCAWTDGGGNRFMPVVMIQLCTNTNVYLFHLHTLYSKRGVSLPIPLSKILRNENITKVGFATHNDTEGLHKTWGIGLASLVDLRSLSGLFRLPINSLKDASKWCTNYSLNKEDAHDWTRSLVARELRISTIEYAALDAIVCLETYKYIQRLYKIDTRIDIDDDKDQEYAQAWLMYRVQPDTLLDDILVDLLCKEYIPWSQKYYLEQRKMKALEVVNKIKKVEKPKTPK
jgi:hypothetical protein